MQPVKPGFQTSEFWLTVGLQLVAFLVLLGWIAPQDRTTVEGAVSAAVQSVGALLASGGVLWRYIAAREYLKQPPTDTST